METFADRYAQVIIQDLLRLERGEALSVNTEQKDFEFAKLIARKAAEVTGVTVKIVQTDSGKPVDVTEFDPETLQEPVSGYAMLRLAHTEPEEQGEILENVVEKDNLAAVQKLGHLADPVLLNRRISVPWCVVPVYGANDPRLQELEKKLQTSFENTVLAASYRRQFLHRADIHRLHLTGEDTDFAVELPEDIRFTGGETQLAGGRRFLSGLYPDRLVCAVDKNSAEGHFRCTARVMGKKQNLELVFRNGILTEHTPSRELERLLEFDPNLRRLGWISLRDKEFRVALGGSILESLPTEPETEDEIPEFFNRSLYKLVCDLPEKLHIEITDCSGKVTELARSGFILE